MNPETPDITSAAFKADPFPYYARLRAEAPVQRVTLPNRQPVWLITRYDDALRALRDPALIKNRHSLGARGQVNLPRPLRFMQALERNMLDLDGADHARLRALSKPCARALKPSRHSCWTARPLKESWMWSATSRCPCYSP